MGILKKLKKPIACMVAVMTCLTCLPATSMMAEPAEMPEEILEIQEAILSEEEPELLPPAESELSEPIEIPEIPEPEEVQVAPEPAETQEVVIPAVVTYPVKIKAGNGGHIYFTDKNGSVLMGASGKEAAELDLEEGASVYFMVTADDGYQMEKLELKDRSDKDVPFQKKEGSFLLVFRMPASGVSIRAEFSRIPEETVDEYWDEPDSKEEEILPFEEPENDPFLEEAPDIAESPVIGIEEELPFSEENPDPAPELPEEDPVEESVMQDEMPEEESEQQEPAPVAEEESKMNAEEAEKKNPADDAEENADKEEEDPYFISEDFDYSQYSNINFSSKRIMVGTFDESIFVDKDVVISGYNGVYLLQFEEEEEALRAYAYYDQIAEFVEADTGIMIAEGEAAGVVNTYDIMTDDANPLAELEAAVYQGSLGSFDIALIDTGADGANASVSVLGDFAGDDNGHGTSMLAYIREQNPDARVLSIKALGSNGIGNVSEIYAAIQYAISQNVKIINLSISALASSDSSVINDAVNEAVGRGILVVGSAGNNGRNASFYVPGGISSATIIGAADLFGRKLSTSNYGATVDYNVIANATSEAAAKFSGWVSLHGADSIAEHVNQGFVYTTDYEPSTQDEIARMEALYGAVPFIIQNAGQGTTDTGDGYYEFYPECNTIEADFNPDDFRVGEFIQVSAVFDNEGYYYGGFPISWSGIRGKYGWDAYIPTGNGGQFTWGYPWKIQDSTSSKDSRITFKDADEYSNWLFTTCIAWDQSDLFPEGVLTMPFRAQLYIRNIDSEGVLYCFVRIFVTNPTNPSGEAQDKGWFMKIKPPKKGTVSLTKTSTESEESLKGALYGIKNDNGKRVGFFVTTTRGTGYEANRVTAEPTSGRLYTKYGNYYYESTGSTTMSLSPGEYTAEEIKAPDNKLFEKNTGTYTFTVKENKNTALEYDRKSSDTSIFNDLPVESHLKLKKSTSSDKSLKGALYKIFTENGKTAGFFVTRKDGTGFVADRTTEIPSASSLYAEYGQYYYVSTGETVLDLKAGNYYVKEIAAPENGLFEKRTGQYDFSLAIGETKTLQYDTSIPASIVLNDQEKTPSYIKFRKEREAGSSNTASLAGAVYGLYTSPSTDDRECYIITNGNGVGFLCKRFSAKSSEYTVTYGEQASEYITGRLYRNMTVSYADGSTLTFDWGIKYSNYWYMKTNTQNINVDPGKYYVSERIPPASGAYKLDKTFSGAYTVGTGETITITVSDPDETANFTLNKKSTNVTITNNNSHYSLKGAQYGVYTNSSCTEEYLYKVITTDDSGIASLSEIPFGKYYVKEIIPSKGYAVDNTTHTLNFSAAAPTASLVSQETPLTGSLQIEKVMDLSNIGAEGKNLMLNNSNYSVNGAVYRVYTDQGCTKLYGGNNTLTITAKAGTNLEGSSNIISGLPLGTYYLKETIAGKNLELDATVYTVDINGSNYNKVQKPSSVSKDRAKGGAVKLTKESMIPEMTAIHPCYSLEGAKYGIYTSISCSADSLYKEVVTNEDGVWEVTGLPFGTYYIKELEPSRGFGLAYCASGDPVDLHEVNITATNPSETITCEEPVVGDPIAIQLQKEDAENGETEPKAGFSFENAEFVIRYYDNYQWEGIPVREWVIITDQDGIAWLRPEYLKDNSDELYFGIYGDVIIPLGSFTIQETVAPFGYEVNETIFKYQVNEPEEITYVENDGGIVPANTNPLLVEQGLLIPETAKVPEIGTILVNEGTEEHYAPARGFVTLTDTISYKWLETGKEYTAKGILMNKATEQPVLDKDGKEITSSTTFSPEQTEGNVEVLFTFDAEGLDGIDAVAFESVYAEGELIAEHCELTDEGQSIHFPEAKTTLKDSVDEEKDAFATQEIVLVDTVKYKNLVAGKEYTVSGILMDKETVLPALDDEGQEIKATASFVPQGNSGEVELTIVFSGISLAGHSLVAYETIYRDGKEVVVHADIEDEDQTVDVPEIHTSLNDSVDGEKDADATETITLIDTVIYKNLIPGRQYTMKGQLMDQESGEPAVDDEGQEIFAETAFIPEEKDGTVDVVFTFSGISLKGHSVVAFEDLCRDDKQVAVHAEIADKNQTVDIPEIGTSLKDEIDGENDALAGETITLVDTVTYRNLLIGKQYTVTGILMDKEAGSKLLDEDGNEVTAKTTFIAEEKDGTVDVVFTFQGISLQGRSIVAFEDLYRDDKHVAVHADMEDLDQTVDVPKVETTLRDSIDDQHDAFASEDVVLIDTVIYHNLHVGETYTVSGMLMDKETQLPAVDDDGNNIVSEPVSFLAETTDGSVDITFRFKGVSLKGHTVVAFEKIYHKEKEVGVHEDLTDEDQIVYIPAIATELLDSTTGLHNAQNKEGETVNLTDYISYKHLIPGKSYKLHGILMNRESGKVVLNKAGSIVENTITFIPEAPDGAVNMTFMLDAVPEDGITLVAYEELYTSTLIQPEGEEAQEDYELEKLVAEHKDIADDAQTVSVPQIRTTLTDENNVKVVNGSQVITLQDEVVYKNLYPNKEYNMEGQLVDKKTANPVLDKDGNPVVSTIQFIPEKSEGSVILTFTFEVPESYLGQSIVAFESLSEDKQLLAVHADITDWDQTVQIPKIGTTATFDNGSKVGDQHQQTVIKDTVAYANLIAGETYVLKGILMDQTTEKPAQINGKPVTVEKTFRAEQESGSVEMQFTIPKESLSGKQVVFEELFLKTGKDEIKVGEHKEITDEGQTVVYPEVSTVAKFASGLKVADNTEKTTIIDTVHYKGLVAGKSYLASGTLMDKATKRPVTINGKELVAKQVFMAKDEEGETEIKFEVPAKTLTGTYVVFEEIIERTPSQEDIIVATHKDIEDEAQAVFYPEIKTRAGFAGGSKNASSNTMQTITDVVSYRDFVQGTYSFEGMLVNKAGKSVTANGNPITAKSSVTVEKGKESGSVSLTFQVPANAVVGEVVVFEEVYAQVDGKRILVGSHKDPQDRDQTVTFDTPNPPVKTGDETHSGLWLMMTLLAMMAVGAGTVVLLRRRKENR